MEFKQGDHVVIEDEIVKIGEDGKENLYADFQRYTPNREYAVVSYDFEGKLYTEYYIRDISRIRKSLESDIFARNKQMGLI